MAGINIRNLTNTTAIEDNDYIIVEQATGTKKATVADITKSSTSVHHSEPSGIIEIQKPEMVEKINNIETTITEVNSQLEQNTTQLTFLDQLKLKFVYGAKGDGITDDSQAFQKYLDDIADNGGIMFIPNGIFYIANPLILKDGKSYRIDGINPCMNFGYKVNNQGTIKPKTILFKGELLDKNTEVYMNINNIRIFFEQGPDGYTKNGTYLFYNLNLFGLTLDKIAVRYVDVFCQGFISKASSIQNIQVGFIKTALFRGSEFNGAFMADSQITNCYFSGAYPCTMFTGTSANSTISNCFFDFFKHMQSLPTSTKCDGLKFKDCTIGMFYRWFKENKCNGHVEILDNKIEACSQSEIQKWKSTNFVEIDTDMESGTYGVFYATSWQENIYNYDTKCKVYNNRFVGCDNVFTKSNSISQVDIKNNEMENISGTAYELSYRKDSLGENASFYCDALDNMVVNELPTISSNGEYFVFNGQRCFLNCREYVLIDYNWIEVANNNVFSISPIPIYTGTYDRKPLYKRLMRGTISVGSTGFKTPINIPEAEILFVDLTHSYWNITGQSTKFSFNANIRAGVIDKSINLLAYDSRKVLMYQPEGALSDITIDYTIAVEYTIA